MDSEKRKCTLITTDEEFWPPCPGEAAQRKKHRIVQCPRGETERQYAECKPEATEQPMETSEKQVLPQAQAWLKDAVDGREADPRLTEAATRGDTEGMELARSQGATAFSAALFIAARHGQLKAMELARAWGTARDREIVMRSPAMHDIALKWDTNRCQKALLHAAEKGQLEAMGLLREWGATSFGPALVQAAAKNQQEAMDLLRAWEAPEDMNGDEAPVVPNAARYVFQ